jgi:V/A-type H+-transporting ATPase subunit E
MEVLNTGEELGRQILEDARKKASRLLEAADRECAAVCEEVRKATDAESARLAAERDRRRAALRTEMEAALPLDFLRRRLTFIQDTVVVALRTFLAGLSVDDLAAVIERRVRRASAAFEGRTIAVRRGGIDEARVRALLGRAAPGVGIDTVQEIADGRGVEIESSDGRVRFRCTTAELEAELLEDRREELAVAALGRGALEAAT